jgi:hypothetical protein
LVTALAGSRGSQRAVDLGFPEFTRHVHTLESQLAATILSRYPNIFLCCAQLAIDDYIMRASEYQEEPRMAGS